MVSINSLQKLWYYYLNYVLPNADESWRRRGDSQFDLGDDLSQISASEAARGRASLDGKNPLLEFAMRYFRGGRDVTSPEGTLR